MFITLIGNKDGVYIDPLNCNALVDYSGAVNAGDVNLNGVNNLVIDRDDFGKMKIIQAGGYTETRGLFVDLY